MKPIAAVSFHATTGSIGGSEGIAWKDSDGRPMIAYLSFSDLVGQYGTAGIIVDLVQSGVRRSEPSLDGIGSTAFDCEPDLASYRD
jgi:hypothetical protein